jgi:hypothetical protein
MMSKDQIAEDILELRADAVDARRLAATFRRGAAKADLLNYASALDREAAQLETVSLEAPAAGLASRLIPLGVSEPRSRWSVGQSH